MQSLSYNLSSNSNTASHESSNMAPQQSSDAQQIPHMDMGSIFGNGNLIDNPDSGYDSRDSMLHPGTEVDRYISSQRGNHSGVNSHEGQSGDSINEFSSHNGGYCHFHAID